MISFRTEVKPRTSKAFISEASHIEFDVNVPVITVSAPFYNAKSVYLALLDEECLFLEEEFEDTGENFRIIEARFETSIGVWPVDLYIYITRS